MANERQRRSMQSYAAEAHMKSASEDPPPNSVKRVLRRFPSEDVNEAVSRAQLMPWWPAVINPTPKGDVRWWVWFVNVDEV